MEQKTNLTKDLKRTILIALIIMVALAVLYAVNLKTNFLLNLTDLIMGKT
ncbi:hypothetical protein ISS21_00535 [Patescibacteria group bacterium]|nr:hypothetical protein [Patescibacteria group bacterium]